VRNTSLTLIGALLVFFQSMDSRATGIYQMEYGYSFDGIARDSRQRQTFVICEDARVTAPYLVRASRLPGLSVKVSQDLTVGRESTERGPERESREITVRKDTGEKNRGSDGSITILFDLDSSTLNDTERVRLFSFVESSRAAAKGSDLSVTGYTCDLGSKAHNDALARKRAETVATYLQKAGMYLSRVTGVGKCCYTTEDQGTRHLNRRVEVRINQGEATL
jgi:OmpA-OmpF porin, OOP family